MLESVRGFFGEILGYQAADPRKKEYGSLDDVRNDNKQGTGGSHARSDRNRLRRRRAVASNGDPADNRKYVRPQNNNRVSKMRNPPARTGRSTFSKLMKSIKNVFSTEDQDLSLMQQACGNTNAMLPPAARRGAHQGSEGRKRLRDRIVRSEAFKRKLLEIEYDDRMLEQVRRGRSVSGGRRRISDGLHDFQPLQDDKVILLQRKLQELDSKVQDMDKELQITQKKLKFAQEKNTLLESLLDDANIDSEYVKSRRDIKNLQKENLKPEAELPPSPRRSVNPLFTSSPMRKPSSAQDQEQEQDPGQDPTQNFYSKYPKIPETELLVQGRDRTSLSPIRIDYSKYST
ncbi:hypothetical protein ZYGR_0AK00420 [Zygosaccharomyces rouxii]|uniref:Uncharacterized protein n=1 Tax=Zygosaccharomyces rouxii TaxID=4956 RepID=A0A1Q3AD31_ZYGRO|nr:hypothetical protein ZYGR_0AK00420 [Zygosaccharomyces rouxii]